MKKSKLGFVLVAVYLLITAYFVYDSNTCSGMFCGLSAIFPILPWSLLLENFSFFRWISDGQITYWFLVALNTSIFYFIGLGIETVVMKFRK